MMRIGSLGFIATFLLQLLILSGFPGHTLAAEPPEWTHLEQAKDYREQGKLKEAIIELKNILQKNPDSAVARLLLAETYLDLGQGANAEKELRRAGKAGLDPDALPVPLGQALLLQGKFSVLLEEIEPRDLPTEEAAQVHAMRGEAHLGLQELEQANDEFLTALAMVPGTARALLGQARLTLAQGKTDQARQRIETALAADPDAASAWSLLGDLEQAEDNYQEAAQAYGEAIERLPAPAQVQIKRSVVRTELGDYAGAGEDIAAVKDAHPRHLGVLYAEGLLAFRQARFEDARTAFEQVLAIARNDMRSLFFFGAAQYELGNLQQAELYLARVVRQLPQADDGRRLLGLTRLRLGNFTGAEEALTPLLERQPDDPVALRALGKALAAQGKREQSSEYLERAVALEPDSASDRLELGVSHLSLGARGRGLAELQRASELDPELLQADLLLIRAHLEGGEFDQALAVAERLRTKQPDNPDPLTLMGIAYAGQGESAKASGAFEQALEMQPGNPSAAINLATLALNEGDTTKARDYYQQVLAHHPAQPSALLRLAELERRQGNRGAAKARLEEAVEQNPEALRPIVALARFHLDAREPLKALTILRQAAQRYAEHPVLLAVQGQAQLSAGEAAAAVGTLQRLVEKQPESARAHYLLGSAYAARKDAAAAKQELLAGLQRDPDDLLASRLITSIVSLQPNLGAKNKLIEELKQLQPEHPQVLDLEAQLALKGGDPVRSLAIYAGLHQRFPDNPVWTMTFAKAQWQAGDQTGHVQTLETWLQAHPEDLNARYMLANSYLRLNRLAEARGHFSKVLERAPDNVAALNNLAWLLREEDPQRALVYAKKAYRLRPDEPAVMDTLGMILLRQGQPAQALELLYQAKVRSPHRPTLAYHYAIALAENGKQEEARRVLKDIRDAEFPEREQARVLLTELGG